MLFSHRHFQFWKHCSKDLCVTCLQMSSTLWNLLLLRVILSLGNRKSWEGRDRVNRGIVEKKELNVLPRISNWQCCVSRCIIMMEEPDFWSPYFWLQGHSSNILCRLCTVAPCPHFGNFLNKFVHRKYFQSVWITYSHSSTELSFFVRFPGPWMK
jgi:hypothetical protein